MAGRAGGATHLEFPMPSPRPARARALPFLALPALIAPIALPARSCAATPPAHAPSLSLEPATARLTAALDAVRVEELREDVFFVASDEMGGRDTPSPGLAKTARFLADAAQEIGWKPGAGEGWFQRYPLASKRLDERASSAAVVRGGERAELGYQRDVFVTSSFQVEAFDVEGGVVYCGAGTEADFERAAPKGRWALCVEGDESARRVAQRARTAGALGLLVARRPGAEGEPYEQGLAGAVERVRQGSVTWPRKEEGGEERRRERMPQLFLGAKALAALVGGDRLPELGADLGVTFSDRRRLAGDGATVEVENVCAFWPGSDPALSKEVILVSAHYDHVGTREGQVYNGADDNGSGTATLLAVARALAAYGPLRRSVMLIWVSGEEKGLWGSQYWSEHPTLPEGHRAVADVNLDMVGRNAPDKLLVTPTRDHEEYNAIVRLAEQVAPLEGFPVLGSADEYYHRSDHKNFAKLGIPVAFLFSDVHEDYHEPGDDAEKLDYDKVRRVARLVVRLLDRMQAEDVGW